MKPDSAPSQRPAAAAAEKARPESAGAAQKDEKPGGARGAENKADERMGRGAGENAKPSPTAAEKKPDMPKTDEKAERARDTDKTTAQGQDKSRDSDKASGRADRGKTAPGDEKAGRAGPTGGEQARDKTGPAASGATPSRDNARPDDRSGVNVNARVNIDETQRSRLTTYFEKHRGPRVDRVDFDINVGVRIPTRVRVAPLPREIATIVPEYRGYEYVMVRDEIVIVRPGTREIVTVIPASTSSAARGAKLDPCGNRS